MNDGGPAFPSDFLELPGSGFSKGMSVRDWFAGLAMQGMLAVEWNLPENEIALKAYQQADAMIEARENKPGTKSQ